MILSEAGRRLLRAARVVAELSELDDKLAYDAAIDELRVAIFKMGEVIPKMGAALADQERERDEADETRLTGVIKWFSHVRGYGFIALEVGGDVLILPEVGFELVGRGWRLLPGMDVEFKPYQLDDGKIAAKNLRLL